MDEKIKTKVGDVGVGDTIVFVMGPGHKDEAEVTKVDSKYKDLSNKGRVEVIDRSKRILWVYPSQVKEIKSAMVKRVARALTLMSSSMTLEEFNKTSGTNFKFKTLNFKGNLDLRGDTGITSLPDNLKVNGWLDLSGCRNLVSLGKNLQVNGDLDLTECRKLTKLPDNLHVGGWLDLWNCTNLTSLPEGLNVGGNLNLEDRKSILMWLIKERRIEWLKERVGGEIWGLEF